MDTTTPCCEAQEEDTDKKLGDNFPCLMQYTTTQDMGLTPKISVKTLILHAQGPQCATIQVRDEP